MNTFERNLLANKHLGSFMEQIKALSKDEKLSALKLLRYRLEFKVEQVKTDKI